MSTGQLQTRESFGDEMAEAAHLKERLEGLQSELQFEENIEKALLLSSKMTPEQLRVMGEAMTAVVEAECAETPHRH